MEDGICESMVGNLAFSDLAGDPKKVGASWTVLYSHNGKRFKLVSSSVQKDGEMGN